jgi:hypothetical protein
MNAAVINEISDSADSLDILRAMIEKASDKEVTISDFIGTMTTLGASREQAIAALHQWVSDGQVRFTETLGIARS